MAHVNIEIKARCGNPDRIRQLLEENGADYRGRDRQEDTYFDTPAGRLKLRQQCEHYMQLFNITETDLIKTSYSDMLIEDQQ